MRWFIFLGAVMSLFSGAALHAQQAGPLPPDQIIAIRKAMMDLQNGVAGAMKGAVDAKQDVKPFVPGAKGLVSSSKVIPLLFPAGTEKGGDTKAKPDIWSDQAGFQKAAANLTAAAEKLVPLADANDKEGFATQFAAVGQACGACHRNYRVRD
jgi:cytochrome c556